jgi:hypothetical protein
MKVIISANRTGPRSNGISKTNLNSEKNPITNSIHFYLKEFLETPHNWPDSAGWSNGVYYKTLSLILKRINNYMIYIINHLQGKAPPYNILKFGAWTQENTLCLSHKHMSFQGNNKRLFWKPKHPKNILWVLNILLFIVKVIGGIIIIAL